MESLLPTLFTFSFFAPLVLRFALAYLFFTDAKTAWGQKEQFAGVAATVLGLFFLVGLFVQVATIAGIVFALILSKKTAFQSVFGNRATLVVAIAIFLSLLVTGAGGFAFDLPY